MKVLIEIQVRHVHSEDWVPMVIEVTASSRKEVTKNLEAIDTFYIENCIGAGWTTGATKVLSAKAAKDCAPDEQLTLKDGKVSQ